MGPGSRQVGDKRDSRKSIKFLNSFVLPGLLTRYLSPVMETPVNLWKIVITLCITPHLFADKGVLKPQAELPSLISISVAGTISLKTIRERKHFILLYRDMWDLIKTHYLITYITLLNSWLICTFVACLKSVTQLRPS